MVKQKILFTAYYFTCHSTCDFKLWWCYFNLISTWPAFHITYCVVWFYHFITRIGVSVRVMVFNGTFSDISVISWWSVLLVEENHTMQFIYPHWTPKWYLVVSNTCILYMQKCWSVYTPKQCLKCAFIILSD